MKQLQIDMKKHVFILFAVGLGLTASIFGQVPNYVSTNGLVGYWSFNGNANDESGNGNNGTVNGATLTTDRFGVANKAYSFDGVSNSILVNHQPIFNMGNNYTISSWFNLIDFNSVRTIINKNITGEGKNDYFNLSILNNSGIIYLQFGDGILVDTIGTTVPITLNTWHNAQMVMGDSVSLYLDGVLIGKKIRALSPLENTNPISIGHWINQNIFYKGKIDDIGIWNRALSHQEITALYNGCSSNVISLQPNNVSTSIGTSAQFIVNASLGATYQWQTDLGVGFQNLSNAGQYSGTNNDTLVVSNLSSSNNNQQFRCIVNSESCTDTSNIVILTVSTIDVNDIINENFLVLYPNPASDHITIDNGNFAAMAGYSIKIENNAGQQVFQSAINQAQFYVDLSTWSGNGLYFVHLIDAQGNTVTVRKIVLQ